MERLRGVLTVVFLLFIVVLSVFAAWKDTPGVGESGPGTQEEMIRERLDNWIPLAP